MSDNAKKGVVKILAPDLPGAGRSRRTSASCPPSPRTTASSRPTRSSSPSSKSSRTRSTPRRDDVRADGQTRRRAGRNSKSGDIVGIATTEPGIDIAHTGLVIVDESGVPHFMDASSSKKKMQVTFEPGPISESHSTGRQKLTGAVFARPLEPGNSAGRHRRREVEESSPQHHAAVGAAAGSTTVPHCGHRSGVARRS